MQWFRTKSKGRESVGLPMPDFDNEPDTSMASLNAEKHQQVDREGDTSVNDESVMAVSPVQVVVTTPTSTTPRSARTPPALHTQNVTATGHPHRTPSSATDTSFTTPSLVARFRQSVTVGGGGGSSSYREYRSGSSSTPGGQLRIHHGAVDQTTITTKPPPEVMKHVREVLEGMGVEVQVESEYKYRCIRGKKKKATMGPGSPIGGSVGPSAAAGNGLAAVTMVGSAASNGVRFFFRLCPLG